MRRDIVMEKYDIMVWLSHVIVTGAQARWDWRLANRNR